MNVKIDELMTRQVITAQPHYTVQRVRDYMNKNHLHAVPVVDSEDKPVGIVTSADLLDGLKEASPISQVMTPDPLTIPQYNGAHQAARLMRKHRVHHVLVTHEKTLVGILSTFDLLQLVEEHRFVRKPGPTPKGKR